jgi:hypothetical protein
MLSAAKHLCSFSQVLEPKTTAEILRFAQDDRSAVFSHLQRAGIRAWMRIRSTNTWLDLLGLSATSLVHL